MLSRPQPSSSQPTPALRRAQQDREGDAGHQPLSQPSLTREEKITVSDNAAEITSLGFSAPGDEMETYRIGQDLGFDQPMVHDNSSESEATKPAASFRTFAPLSLPSAPSIADGRGDVSLGTKVSAADRKHVGKKTSATATSLTRGKMADFFPWGVDSAENVLNENVIRNGYADKPPGSNQSESHTARPSVWPSVKNKAGLPLLSALLVQVMEKRQASGRCTAPSSFKPPPRVTLTDTKREAWLRDLASSDVPLRKLSRTIPHGIRGKTLLDHCLGKTIPIPRAVWLAKCVGANELRAFRRKGISGSAALSGENQWIREWTVLVEAFLDLLISDCGRDDWRLKMDYALRLTTAFFAENLLDNGHYLSWIMNSFETATLERLPIWIVFVQLYWKQLVRKQKRGRRLAEVLLGRLSCLREDHAQNSNAALVSRLERLIVTLASAHGGCLIAMQTWESQRHVLQRIMTPQLSPDASSSLNQLMTRNDRLRFSGRSANRQAQSAKLQLINLLSSLPIVFDVDKTASQCASILTDSRDLVTTLLSWASSRFRTGEHRLYVVCSILGRQHSDGSDLELEMLIALSSLAENPSFDRRILHKIFTRLVHSGHFSFGKYLQRLISMGALSGARTTSADLLADLPVANCPTHLLNLRNTLMRRLGMSSVDQEDLVINLYLKITNLVKEVSLEDGAVKELMISSSQIGTPAQSRISQMIRAGLQEATDTNAMVEAICKHPTSFRLLRNICELWHDYDLLTLILQTACQSVDLAILSGIADTLNMHAEVFGAMGVLQECFLTIYQKQRVLRSQQPLDRRVLLSLSNLAARFNTDSGVAKVLANDLALCEQQGSAAACSPASDNMILTTAGAIASDADIDRILASGNTMDEQVMARLFSAIVERCVKQASGSGGDISPCSRWFAQLRLFDHANFDRLSQNLLTKLVGNAGIEQIRVLLTALVGSHCLRIDVALQAFDRRIESMSSSNVATTARLALAGLQIFVPPLSTTPDTSLGPDAYSFRLAQASICRLKRYSILHFLKWSFCANVDPTAILTRHGILRLLYEYANEDSQAVTDALIEARSMTTDPSRIDIFLSGLLSAGISEQASSTQSIDLKVIMAILDEFSLPICKMLLKQTIADDSETGSTDLSACVQVSKQHIGQGHSLWPQVIDCMPGRVVREVHQWALEELVKELNGFLTQPINTALSIHQATTYLKIMATSADSEGVAADIDTTNMVEKVVAFNELINTMDLAGNADMGRVCSWLMIVLELVAMCCAVTAVKGSTLTQHGNLLCICCSLLCQTKLQGQHQILESIFDVASLLASSLSSDQLESVSRQLPPAVRLDTRVAFILGTEQSSNGWLVLSSRVPAAGSIISPTTPQGGFTPFGRPGQAPTPLQRTASQANTSAQSSPTSSQRPSFPAGAKSGPQEIKYTPFVIRPWEIMPDPTPNVGENDTSLSLTLFAARRAA